MPHDSIGWIHTGAAIIALLMGTMILSKTKGTLTHKRIGKVYGISMIIVCVTSFMIYRVHNSFGFLHIFAVLSTITLILGMLPMYIKGYKQPYLTHLSWMNWSVIGLYSAFAAEIFTRLPMIFNFNQNYKIFYALVFVSARLVGMFGSTYFKKNKLKWEAQFGASPKEA